MGIQNTTLGEAADRRAKPRRTAPLLPRIDPARCTGCGWCVAVCPPHVLSLQVSQGRKTSVLHPSDGCTGCSLCEPRCPFQAITMERVGSCGRSGAGTGAG